MVLTASAPRVANSVPVITPSLASQASSAAPENQ
jgi:hypothetical protein